jgi:hypothetical protein
LRPHPESKPPSYHGSRESRRYRQRQKLLGQALTPTGGAVAQAVARGMVPSGALVQVARAGVPRRKAPQRIRAPALCSAQPPRSAEEEVRAASMAYLALAGREAVLPLLQEVGQRMAP